MTTQTAPRWPFALIIFFTLLAQGAMILGGITPVSHGHLVDTDSYMWLLRVEDLVNGAGWFNHAVPRMNTPWGDVLNWSRPTDLFILLLALPFHIFLPWREAIFWGGALMGPVLQVGIGLALVWAFRPFTPPLVRALLMLFALLQPPLAAYMLPGRPDHHGLIIILEVLYLGVCTRAILEQYNWERGLLAGFIMGMALWVSVEAQFTLIIITGLFGVLWLWRGGQNRLDFLMAHGGGLFAGILLALLIERGFAFSGDPALDKISSVHLLLSAAAMLVLLPLREREGSLPLGRAVSVAITGAISLVVVWFVNPQALQGPTAQIDPRVLQEFFLQIREMQPLWPTTQEELGTCLLMIGTAFWGLMVWGLVAFKRGLLKPFEAYLPLLVVTLAMSVAALFHARFSMFAMPLGACFLLLGIERFKENFAEIKGQGVNLGRVFTTVGLLLFPLLLAFIVILVEPEKEIDQQVDATGKTIQHCELATLLPTLANPTGLGREPGRIMSSLNYGPELLYFTPHSVVAGPYHRNRDGILDSIDFYNAKDESAAKAILARRGINYVIDCDESKTEEERSKRPQDNMSARLLRGDAPAWLRVLPVPADSDFKLYAVQLD